MEHSTFRRAILTAICCLAFGLALVLLAWLGVAPPEISISGVMAILASVGLLVWIGGQLWAVMRSETVAYRVLYRAEQQLDGEAVARMLQALARNVGYVSIVWRVHSLSADGREAAPAGRAPVKSSEQARLDGADTPSQGYAGSRSPNISMHIVAPATARTALDGMLPGLLPSLWAERCTEPFRPLSPGWGVRAWRWPISSGPGGSLADPFACGIHLGELMAGIGAVAGAYTEPGDIEIRLRLWPRGSSAIVTAQCSMAEGPLLGTVLTPANEADGAVGSHLPFLEPLLRVLSWQWPPARAQRNKDANSKSSEAGRQMGKIRQTYSPVFTGTSGRLVSALAARYPLWEPSGTALRFTSKRRSREEADVDCEGGPPSSAGMFFPPTTGFYLSLDSVAAGEVPPPAAYVLPPIASQVLVLGRATYDGRVIGVPALRRSQSASPNPVGSMCTEPQARMETAVPDQSLRTRMRLHPMLSEHLLVVGGSDAWRRDVAGSLVSQALEIGMTVVAVDGGAAPDEPPASARKRSRIVSAEIRGHKSGFAYTGSAGFAGAATTATTATVDPLSSVMLRLGDSASVARRVAQIDMDNPAGSVRPNILYVPAPTWLPPVQGEAFAALQALRTGLDAQMRFLQAVNVTGIDAGISGMSGISGKDVAGPGDGGWAMALVEAWLTVLLLRHHRARLLLASRGITLPPEETTTPEAPSGARRSASSIASFIPACPDLPALLLVLEQPETLLSLLRRERDAWSDSGWMSLIQNKGGIAGEQAVRAAQEALDRARAIEGMDLTELFLYGAALRGQLKRILGHPAMVRMLNGPHISMSALLRGSGIRMLRVNLTGAYRTAANPYSEDDLARKHYGLYLLWSLWAASRQREALSMYELQDDPHGCVEHREPQPVLLMLHGAGAWFGSGSPLSEAAQLKQLGHERSGIAIAATVSGLRHLRAYRAGACETFGNLVMGPAPVADLDAPDVTLSLVDTEARLLRDGMLNLADRIAPEACDASSHLIDIRQADQTCQAHGGDRLLEVLRRIEEGTALLMTGVPGGGKAVATAHVSSGVASDVRNSWLSPATTTVSKSDSRADSPISISSSGGEELADPISASPTLALGQNSGNASTRSELPAQVELRSRPTSSTHEQ